MMKFFVIFFLSEVHLLFYLRIVKNTVKKIPIDKLYFRAKEAVRLIEAKSFLLAKEEIEGSSMADKAFVMAEGNIIKGILIPSIVPYILMAIEKVMP